MELKGKITNILPQESGTKKDGGTWTSQTFILFDDTEKYPNEIAIGILGDNVTIPPIGTEIKASINIKSREYNGKYYTNLTAWRIDVISQAQNHEVPPPASEPLETDDLPF